jgi:hypothetical protein
MSRTISSKQQGKYIFSLLIPTKPNTDHEIALIKRGGGKRPDEARQPACSKTGRVPIPADYAFRKMRGLSKNAQPLEMQGLFYAF